MSPREQFAKIGVGSPLADGGDRLPPVRVAVGRGDALGRGKVLHAAEEGRAAPATADVAKGDPLACGNLVFRSQGSPRDKKWRRRGQSGKLLQNIAAMEMRGSAGVHGMVLPVLVGNR